MNASNTLGFFYIGKRVPEKNINTVAPRWLCFVLNSQKPFEYDFARPNLAYGETKSVLGA